MQGECAMSQNPQFIDTNKLETTLKNEEVLVSVIVPVYNVQEYLTQCLESIVSQSYGNLDIVLIDDGSTDSSVLFAILMQKTIKYEFFIPRIMDYLVPEITELIMQRDNLLLLLIAMIGWKAI